MDWANERYVRLYTRDTVTWSLLNWQARCIFPLIMRKVDRAGVIDCPRNRPVAHVIARLIDVPEEIVAEGLEDLDASGVLAVGDDGVVVRNFVEAQETPSSDAKRRAEHRARQRRDSKIANNRVTPRHAASHVVPPEPAEPTDLTEPTTQIPPQPPKGGAAHGPDKSPPAKRRSKSRKTEPDPLVDEVLALMRQAVQQVTGGRDHGPRASPGNTDLIRVCTRREGATLEDWRKVITAQATSVRGDPDKWRYLALSTITRRQNWLRLLDAPVARGSPRGPVDPSTQNYEAENPF